MLQICDGLLLTGGGDVHPRYFREELQPQCGMIEPERDIMEISLAKAARNRSLPLLGICRGMQVMNIACGGNIYQDLDGFIRPCFNHMQETPRTAAHHPVRLIDPWLQQLLKTKMIWTNSFHHQAIKRLAPGLGCCAKTGDGIIEAFRSLDDGQFFLGVQWHPEDNTEQRPIFAALIRAAAEAAAAKRLNHKR